MFFQVLISQFIYFNFIPATNFSSELEQTPNLPVEAGWLAPSNNRSTRSLEDLLPEGTAAWKRNDTRSPLMMLLINQMTLRSFLGFWRILFALKPTTMWLKCEIKHWKTKGHSFFITEEFGKFSVNVQLHRIFNTSCQNSLCSPEERKTC